MVTPPPSAFASFASRVAIFACTGFLAVEVLALVDLYSFEFSPLYQLVGLRGLLLIAFFNIACLVALFWARARLKRLGPRFPVVTHTILVCAGLAAVYVLQYVFMERPVTVRIATRLAGIDSPFSPPHTDNDFLRFSLATSARDTAARAELRVMYERIRINAPGTYERHPIGATIDRYATRYQIDPVFLFFRAYLNSYYGEATSGPVPFLGTMTAETIRDVVQIHVPGWFVESGVRRRLVTSQFFPRLAGDRLGFKLRYAAHKATLDVSTQPYDLNTFSDTFLVLREFEGEFPDIFNAPNSDSLRSVIRETFLALRGSALVPPYERPYETPTYDSSYYEKHRVDMRRFARAVYYLTALDFDFATRVQALLSAYQRDVYTKKLGQDRWTSMPRWQRLAMFAMIRDLYTPNVGRFGYNLYALPELNCTPVEYVASEAALDGTAPGPDQTTIWIPSDPSRLWAGAGYQLTVLNEVWSLVSSELMPGVQVNRTVDAARVVLALSND